MNYYNEHNRYVAEWLRELIQEGHIPEGVVDERDIQDVKPTELREFVQCHFFAGIGGWSLALRLAGWPDDEPCWTGSCPCQPFSVAGKGLGKKDPRHIWPQFRRLIRQCSPGIVFGEQVASADGRLWLDGVQADLEALGYANCGADICAAGVGSPNIRQRLFWMAHAEHAKRRAKLTAGGARLGRAGFGGSGGMGHSGSVRLDARITGDGRTEEIAGSEHRSEFDRSGESCGLEDTNQWRFESGSGTQPEAEKSESRHGQSEQRSIISRMADGEQPRLEGHAGNGEHRNQPGRNDAQAGGPATASGGDGFVGLDNPTGARRPSAGEESEGEARDQARLRRPELGRRESHWDRYDIIPFRDGKKRRVEPGSFPLVARFPERVELLRGYGNSICPQAAAEFIGACVEALDSLKAQA